MTTSVILALATGLSVVATKHSGFPDQIIPGRNGFLSNESDPDDLADKIILLINESSRWGEMSDFARAHALAMYDQKALMDQQLACYQKIMPEVKKVAFFTGGFPTFGLTWLISQVSDLNDRGIQVEIFHLNEGNLTNVSEKYFAYHMGEHMHSLVVPKEFPVRIRLAIKKIFHLLIRNPIAFFRSLNFFKYGMSALSLKLVFWVEPFLDQSFDVMHCHFGTAANKYLIIKEILGLEQEIIVSFYGYDVSHVIKEKGLHYYDRLQSESSLFIAMSQDMKSRIVATGFAPSSIQILPISIDVTSVPFARRELRDDETIHIATIGRFVEKKGFDDLLRSLVILKNKLPRKFICHIIGGGDLEQEWKSLAHQLGVDDVVDWRGYMRIDDIPEYLLGMHLYVQPSKTASNGDIE